MNLTGNHNQQLLEWAVAAQPISGETVSGDLHVIQPFVQGVLLAVIDGLGHGDDATEAAQTAMTVLKENPHESVISLIKRCHALLTHTRGVVMTIASLNAVDGTVTWLGVGNVEGWLLRINARAGHPRENVLLRSGLVGYQLPPLHASVISIAAGDLLIFATDGIRPDFAEGVAPGEAPQRIADHIMARHFKGNDDALVLVGRYRGATMHNPPAQTDGGSAGQTAVFPSDGKP